jgi:hypothetical protein
MQLWDQLLDQAVNEAAIVDIAQDYVASLTPADLVTVPPECRPGRIRDHSDIDYWNLKLADEVRNLWGTERDGRMLTEMSHFFLRASVRLSHLNDHPPHLEPHAA